MITNTEFIVPQKYIDLIVEVQDMAAWANQEYSYKILCKIYDMTTDFLEEEGLFERDE